MESGWASVVDVRGGRAERLSTVSAVRVGGVGWTCSKDGRRPANGHPRRADAGCGRAGRILVHRECPDASATFRRHPDASGGRLTPHGRRRLSHQPTRCCLALAKAHATVAQRDGGATDGASRTPTPGCAARSGQERLPARPHMEVLEGAREARRHAGAGKQPGRTRKGVWCLRRGRAGSRSRARGGRGSLPCAGPAPPPTPIFSRRIVSDRSGPRRRPCGLGEYLPRTSLASRLNRGRGLDGCVQVFSSQSLDGCVQAGASAGAVAFDGCPGHEMVQSNGRRGLGRGQEVLSAWDGSLQPWTGALDRGPYVLRAITRPCCTRMATRGVSRPGSETL